MPLPNEENIFMKHIAVLASGNGSNFQALVDAINEKKLDTSISILITNTNDAFVLKRAEKADVSRIFLKKEKGESRADYDKKLSNIVSAFHVDYVFMLGWMRILTENFLAHHRVVNLHPALPNTFVGTDCIQKQFEAFQAGSISSDSCGIMTHCVPDEKVDAGPVIFSQQVRCIKGEPLETFEKRIHEAEHLLVVKTAAFLEKG